TQCSWGGTDSSKGVVERFVQYLDSPGDGSHRGWAREDSALEALQTGWLRQFVPVSDKQTAIVNQSMYLQAMVVSAARAGDLAAANSLLRQLRNAAPARALPNSLRNLLAVYEAAARAYVQYKA